MVMIILGPSSRDCTDIKVEVRRIDYGDVVYVSLWDVKELCGEAASKPVQVLQVSLVNVGVSSNITVWLIYSFECFELCFNLCVIGEASEWRNMVFWSDQLVQE